MGPGHAWSPACHCHAAQTFPFHRRHLQVWRIACLDTHWPFTITTGPQPSRTCVIKLSGCRSGTRLIACDDVAAKAKSAAAINLIVSSFVSDYGQVLRVAHCGTCRNPQQLPT